MTNALAIIRQVVSVLPSMSILKIENSGVRTSRPCNVCCRRFSTQISGSFTYIRIQMIRRAGKMPIISRPRQPM